MNYGWLVQSLGTVAYNDTVIENGDAQRFASPFS